MPKDGFMDEEERELIAAYSRGEFRPVAEQEAEKKAAVEAARRFLRERKQADRPAERVRRGSGRGASF
ncbi:MAG: hypothetical protein M9913_01000 [Bryobacteraceae bacterium]|nr:hypothetical protein [Solibacteraceae bacterium]MCO5349482.1 hypothetical protein [Bryobacteraceae bacterium]